MKKMNSDELIEISTDNMGKALMGILIQEIKALPKTWQQLSEFDQNLVIDRIRARVQTSVESAVKLIAAKGYPAVVARLESVALKDAVKATFKISRENQFEGVHQLYDSRGQLCQIIISSADDMTGGMDDIKGDKEQQELKLDDPLYNDALQFVSTSGKSTITAVQRELRIGYNRAARLVEMLISNGVISKQENPSAILDTDQWKTRITDWISSIKKERVIINDITSDALGISNSIELSQNQLKTIGLIMADLGWEKVRARVEGGRSSGWVKPL
jgi:predicted transcriptional regulator